MATVRAAGPFGGAVRGPRGLGLPYIEEASLVTALGTNEEISDARVRLVQDPMPILYLNRFLTRFNIWTGERGRQLVLALQGAGAEVQTIPPIPAEEPTPLERPN